MPRSASAPGTEDRLRRNGVLLVILLFLADGLLRTGYFHLGARAQGRGLPFLDSLISELTGSLAVVTVFFLILVPVTRRWPLRGPHWPRHLLVHVGALIVFSICKTLLMWGTRSVLFPLAGLGAYDYGDMLYRFPMEFSNDVFGYAILTAAVHAWDAWSDLRRRELHQAKLEASLSEARLQALQGRLQPHFLFNTLNVISSVMYDDPEHADRLMSGLSDLLRMSLASAERPVHTLAEELHALDEYVEIMRARYGDRLAVRTIIEPGTEHTVVPIFLLQPLVENAIRHGADRRAGDAVIDVTAARVGDLLRVCVEDDGPGLRGAPEDAFGRGVGLLNTRERLMHLFGDRASLRLENRDSGGLRVEARLPAPVPAERRRAPAEVAG